MSQSYSSDRGNLRKAELKQICGKPPLYQIHLPLSGNMAYYLHQLFKMHLEAMFWESLMLSCTIIRSSFSSNEAVGPTGQFLQGHVWSKNEDDDYPWITVEQICISTSSIRLTTVEKWTKICLSCSLESFAFFHSVNTSGVRKMNSRGNWEFTESCE